MCYILTSLAGFDWSSLPVGGKVIDVGGGVGTVSMELAKTQPKLKFVVQDRPPVAADGVKVIFHQAYDVTPLRYLFTLTALDRLEKRGPTLWPCHIPRCVLSSQHPARALTFCHRT